MIYFCKSTGCVPQTAKAKNMYFILYFVFEWLVLAYTFADWNNVVCLLAGKINTHRDT